jgi:adenosine deaminase
MRTLVDHGVQFALSTDGPEMLRSYLRDEIALLLRLDALDFDEIQQALETARSASFVDRAPVPGRADGNGTPPVNRAAIALEVEV